MDSTHVRCLLDFLLKQLLEGIAYNYPDQLWKYSLSFQAKSIPALVAGCPSPSRFSAQSRVSGSQDPAVSICQGVGTVYKVVEQLPGRLFSGKYQTLEFDCRGG